MKYLRKELQGMVPYEAPYITDGIILNANESPFQLPNEIIEKFSDELKKVNFNRYPDMTSAALKDSIAHAYGISRENVACGVGSDELLQCLFNAVCDKGDKVVVMNPSFSMYAEYAKIYGAIPVHADANADFSFNLDNMLRAIKDNNPKMVVICSPNNPTGIVVDREDIKKIVSSTDALIILDEAYGEFDDKTNVDLINEYDNLMVLKTLSKLYSGAAIRFGYALSKKDNIDLIDTVRSPYNVNVLTQTMARIIIENKDLYKSRIEYFKEERLHVYNELKNMGIEVYPSHVNFLWMVLSEKVADELLRNKIYIRTMKFNGKVYRRVSIGTKEENIKFLKVVRDNA